MGTMTARRRFLQVVTAASLGAACGSDADDEDATATGGGSGPTGSTGSTGTGGQASFPEGYVALGTVGTLPVGTLVEIGAHEVIVGRDEGGLYAMSSRCTHQQCNMIGNVGVGIDDVVRCGCHGSSFDANGTPIAGPASVPLPHFEMLLAESGSDTLAAFHPGIVVDQNQRLPLP